MKLSRSILKFGVLGLLLASCVSSSVPRLEVKEEILEDVQMKFYETDNEPATMSVVFRPMERFVFDESGREILYEDLSNGAVFMRLTDNPHDMDMEVVRNDKRREAVYNDKGQVVYYRRDVQDETKNIIRKFNANGTLTYAKGNIKDEELVGIKSTSNLPKASSIVEVSCDEKSNITHVLYESGFEQWWEYDKNSNLLHTWKSNGEDSVWKYDNKGRCVYSKIKTNTTTYGSSYYITESWTEYSNSGKKISLLVKEKGYDEGAESYSDEITTKYEYDSKDNIILESKIWRCLDDESTKTISTYTYSQDGRTVVKNDEIIYYTDDTLEEEEYRGRL